MSRKLFFKILFLFLNLAAICQETEVKTDTIILTKVKKIDASFQVINQYIWRGQSFGGKNITIQTEMNYAITKKLTIGFWASSNFQKNYYFLDGNSGNGYQEIDLNLSYQINKFLKVQLSDYYWPTVETVDNIDNGYFNYSNNSVKTIDASLLLDFSDIWKPVKITASTFLAGNDFSYDNDGQNPKQNFTTYLEIGYLYHNIFKKSIKKTMQNIDLEPVLGFVLNNKAQYYAAADYDKPSFINLGFKITKEFEIDKNLRFPFYFNFTHNAASSNTEQFGKNFAVLGFKLSY